MQPSDARREFRQLAVIDSVARRKPRSTQSIVESPHHAILLARHRHDTAPPTAASTLPARPFASRGRSVTRRRACATAFTVPA
jgi:hypothetical protein